MTSFGDLNSFICIGRLTRDPELKYTPSGAAVCKMGIAVNRSYKKDEEVVEDTLFVNLSAWGKQGENCANYLQKGRRIAVNGELRGNNWVDKDGNKRYSFEVNVNTIQFLDSKNQDSSDSQGDSQDDIDPDDIPD